MADFATAVKWMKQGKKVRRNQYKDTLYIYHINFKEPMNWVETPCGDFAHLTLHELEATDWELVEEEFDLSKKLIINSERDTDYTYDNNYWYDEKDVKEFIKRLKQQIKSYLLYKTETDKDKALTLIDKLAGERLTKTEE